jgi:hypothetical protein
MIGAEALFDGDIGAVLELVSRAHRQGRRRLGRQSR